MSACDKRHNLAALVADVRRDGVGYLDRFSGKPHQQVWYYRAYRDAVRHGIPLSLDDFPERLKRLRLQRGMTQKELALAAGCAWNLIYRWERGFNGPAPDVEVESPSSTSPPSWSFR